MNVSKTKIKCFSCRRYKKKLFCQKCVQSGSIYNSKQVSYSSLLEEWNRLKRIKNYYVSKSFCQDCESFKFYETVDNKANFNRLEPNIIKWRSLLMYIHNIKSKNLEIKHVNSSNETKLNESNNLLKKLEKENNQCTFDTVPILSNSGNIHLETKLEKSNLKLFYITLELVQRVCREIVPVDFYQNDCNVNLNAILKISDFVIPYISLNKLIQKYKIHVPNEGFLKLDDNIFKSLQLVFNLLRTILWSLKIYDQMLNQIPQLYRSISAQQLSQFIKHTLYLAALLGESIFIHSIDPKHGIQNLFQIYNLLNLPKSRREMRFNIIYKFSIIPI
ncbi:hypothetical protein A3Q56_02731 [Intoshia linei]|uniref:Uncharacterized protein n=1 Tax=Intoshia linei TaxID=1819745 RepID=A0A177B5W6_9BILA|nr:hypothetical protein A3Q56_02731 [Intoshia linei]